MSKNEYDLSVLRNTELPGEDKNYTAFKKALNLFTDVEKELIKSLGIELDCGKLSDDVIVEIEEKVSEHLVLNGFNERCMPNRTCILCESILDKLAES